MTISTRPSTLDILAPANGNGHGDPILLRGLHPNHVEELARSGITREVAKQNGIYSEGNRSTLGSLLRFERGTTSAKWGAALVFPYRTADGREAYHRLKFDNPPTDSKGKPQKYKGPRGVPYEIYFPAGAREKIAAGAKMIPITEGEKKAIALAQAIGVAIGIPGVDCWHPKKKTCLHRDLGAIDWRGVVVPIIFDSDAAEKPDVANNAKMLGAAIKAAGGSPRLVALPADPNGEKWGVDDFLVHRGAAELSKLIEFAPEPEAPDPGSEKLDAHDIDPAGVVGSILSDMAIDGQLSLRFWRGAFWRWTAGAYRESQTSEIRARIITTLNRDYLKLTTNIVNNCMDQAKAQTILSGRTEAPSWIAETAGEPWPPEEILVAKNGLVHLPSLIAGRDCQSPATPRFFSTSAVDYEFLANAPRPDAWLRFLEQLWPSDCDSIATLQEWFGYCLTPDTRQQKILMLVGPKRSGKGTIGRLLRAVMGKENVCGPTLASLATNFGLWPMIGKSLAIVSDARLGGRTDSAIVVERLLSISGEDALTIDRKNLEPLTCKLPTRLMILSNELPRLGDASGALAGRMILLRVRESFYGREDHDLTDKLTTELPAILLWAIDGWRRLRERRHFQQPDSALEMLGELHDLSSPISEFIRDCCQVGPVYNVARADLYGRYQEWCREKGRSHVEDERGFGRNLRAAIPALGDSQPRVAGQKVRHYEGIGLVGYPANGG